MKLEAGKNYRTRCGALVGPIEEIPHSPKENRRTYKLFGPVGFSRFIYDGAVWSEEGRYDSRGESGFDLVSEVQIRDILDVTITD